MNNFSIFQNENIYTYEFLLKIGLRKNPNHLTCKKAKKNIQKIQKCNKTLDISSKSDKKKFAEISKVHHLSKKEPKNKNLKNENKIHQIYTYKKKNFTKNSQDKIVKPERKYIGTKCSLTKKSKERKYYSPIKEKGKDNINNSLNITQIKDEKSKNKTKTGLSGSKNIKYRDYIKDFLEKGYIGNNNELKFKKNLNDFSNYLIQFVNTVNNEPTNNRLKNAINTHNNTDSNQKLSLSNKTRNKKFCFIQEKPIIISLLPNIKNGRGKKSLINNNIYDNKVVQLFYLPSNDKMNIYNKNNFQKLSVMKSNYFFISSKKENKYLSNRFNNILLEKNTNFNFLNSSTKRKKTCKDFFRSKVENFEIIPKKKFSEKKIIYGFKNCLINDIIHLTLDKNDNIINKEMMERVKKIEELEKLLEKQKIEYQIILEENRKLSLEIKKFKNINNDIISNPSEINIQNNIHIIENDTIDKNNKKIKEQNDNKIGKRLKRLSASMAKIRLEEEQKKEDNKKTNKISNLAKLLEKKMENNGEISEEIDKNNNKRNEELELDNKYNDKIVSIFNQLPIINKKKKKFGSFTFGA